MVKEFFFHFFSSNKGKQFPMSDQNLPRSIYRATGVLFNTYKKKSKTQKDNFLSVLFIERHKNLKIEI